MIVRKWAEGWIKGADERLEGGSFLSRNLSKVFPDHWTYLFGEVALYAFVILVLTGTFLAFFYVGSPETMVYDGPYQPLQGTEVSAAYDSVLRISYEVPAGLVMRQAHHWAALIFVGAIVAHLLRVFFTGAFRKPRELSWMLGFTLFTLAIGAGFTGYSLPDDLLSGAGLRIVFSVVQSIPFAGTWLAFLLFGGEFPNDALLPRLFVGHVFILPLVLLGVMSAHLAVVWHQTHTQPRATGREESTVTGTPVWPRFAMKSVGVMFATWAVIVGLGGLAQINPVWLYGQFVPYSGPSPAQPDYYAGWLEGLLRLWPDWEFSVFGHTIGELFLPAIVVPGIIFTTLALWPFIEAKVTGDKRTHHFSQRPREAPVRTGIGVAGLVFMSILMLAGSNDVLAKFLGVEVDTLNTVLKWLLFVAPPLAGIAAWRLCRGLRERDLRPIEEPAVMSLQRNAAGGYDEVGE